MPKEFGPIHIVDYIWENMINDELPRNFTLPLEMTKNSLPYADGAKDSIEIYHTYPSGIAEESLPFLDEMLHAASREDYDSGVDNLKRFAEMNSAIAVFRDFQGYITKQKLVDPDKLYDFAAVCAMGYDINVVKYGLEMTALFSEPAELLKEMIRMLGLCNEFTIYVIFNMLHWSNANDEIFALAQKVHGWGRIHAVRYLQPENDEIKKWLLEEGIHNDILPEYTEEEVRRKFMDES